MGETGKKEERLKRESLIEMSYGLKCNLNGSLNNDRTDTKERDAASSNSPGTKKKRPEQLTNPGEFRFIDGTI